MKIGEQVYISRSGNWSTTYHVAKVSKVTPTGIVNVESSGGQTYRFKDGREIGSSFYHHYLDTIPFAERTAKLESEQRACVACGLIQEVKPGELRHTRDKDSLKAEVDRLQAALDKARQAVEGL